MNDLPGIIHRLKNFSHFQEALLNRVCVRLVKVLHDNTPGKNLPDEWTSSVKLTGDGATCRIWNTRPERDPEFDLIMIYLNFGTVMHWVEPVNAQALHWVKDGIHFFSKGHMVSGIQASHFAAEADRAIRDYEKRLPGILKQYLELGIMP